MQPPYILALDQGTTSSRSLLINHQGEVVNQSQQEFEQLYPKPGWVEHRPDDLWDSQWQTAIGVLKRAGISAGDLAGIGIANQRETTLVWDRKTGEPVYNAIVWQDRRTADFCDELKANEATNCLIQEKTGLVIDAYFSASKIRWILDHAEGARARAERGELAFGTVDSWLVWKLTNGERHITDASNASRTMLFNVHAMAWDQELCALFDVPFSMLPEVVDNSGDLAKSTRFDVPVPITGMAGDQQAALFGQQCTSPGMVKNTYGTGCFMLMNTGSKAVPSEHALLTTVAWKLNGQTTYALEGSVFIGGAAVQWLRDELNFIEASPEIEALALAVDSSDGVVVVPAFAGLGAPHWNPHARASILGMTRGTNRSHIARATLESIAFQSMDLLECMQKDSRVAISEVRVDGGASENALLMQIQADALGIRVIRPANGESTAMGAAYFAGLGAGVWKDMNELSACWTKRDGFEPKANSVEMRLRIATWHRAVRAVLNWSNDTATR